MKKLTTVVTRFDLFPLQLGFTYKDQSKLKSSLGGTFSLITIAIIFSYCLSMFNSILNFDHELKRSQHRRDFLNGLEEITFDSSEFDFALNIAYTGLNKTISESIFQYFSLELVEISLEDNFNFSASQRPLDFCSNISENRTEGLPFGKNQDKFTFCPSTDRFALKGSTTSKQFQFYAINVNQCSQEWVDKVQPGEACASIDEQLLNIGDIAFHFAFKNQYFAADNKSSPIQTEFIFRTYFPIETNTQYNFLKLAKNQALLQDSWIFGSLQENNASYSSIRFEQETYKRQDLYALTLQHLGIWIFLDEEVKIDRRSAFTLSQAISQLGGFSATTIIATRVLVQLLKQFLFLSQMVQKLYYFDGGVGQNMDDRDLKHLKESYGKLANQTASKTSRKLFSNIETVLSREKYDMVYQRALSFHSKKGLAYSFLSYFCFPFTPKRTKLFFTAKKNLKHELNIENFIHKIRLFDLYLSLKLKPYQKQILQALTHRQRIETSKSSVESNCPQTYFENAMISLMKDERGKKVNTFNKQLYQLLEIPLPKNTSKEKFQIRRRNKNDEFSDESLGQVLFGIERERMKPFGGKVAKAPMSKGQNKRYLVSSGEIPISS